MNDAGEKERRRLRRVAENMADGAPVVEALRAHGFAIGTVADLFNKKMDYRKAIPVLLEWLPRIANPDVKEAIVRALSVDWAKNTSAARQFVALFEQVDDPTGLGFRWAIGNALEVLATDDIADDLIRLATDRRFGRAREMVVLGLGKLKDPRCVDVLLNLLADDDVTGHAVIALGKLRPKRAREHLEPLLHHQKTWIRKAAKKALARIDKAAGKAPHGSA